MSDITLNTALVDIISEKKIILEISGSYGGDYEEYNFVGCCAMRSA
jgi:hypothetical protein